LDH
jgi:hypothetical protein